MLAGQKVHRKLKFRFVFAMVKELLTGDGERDCERSIFARAMRQKKRRIETCVTTNLIALHQLERESKNCSLWFGRQK